MKLKSLYVIGALLALLTGCATDPIEYSGDAAALPPFRTFSIHEERYVFPEQLSDSRRQEVSDQLRRAAVSALQERGYREVGPGEKADVLVVLGAVSRTTTPTGEDNSSHKYVNKVDTSVFDAMPGPSDAVGGGDITGFAREGDLVLYLLDPATQRSLWRASASGIASSSGEALRKARSAYRAMVRELPKV
ncbi:MAG TPA: DUF4136 domain-containing protein [Povalibacter sp.]|nr:DUF4136 domain-containing protein [Povalibacter sp.]